MKNLKNEISMILALILLSACQTTRDFEIKSDHKEELNIIKVNKNRIIHECYFLNADSENQWRHQYFMYILNDKNEVLIVMYPTNQDASNCEKHKKKVDQILAHKTQKDEQQLTLCIRDRVVQTTDYSDLHDFGSLGKHHTTYNPFTFDTICNSKKCYSISDTWSTTCPGIKEGKAIETLD